MPMCNPPSDELEEVNERYADAGRRELEASVFDQADRKEQATRDKWSAMSDRQCIREKVTRDFLGGLRIALEEQPHQLRELLKAAAGTAGMPDPDVAAAFGLLFARLEKLEGSSQ